MFITKKYISRRTVLRGTGVALALPLLDSMVPAQTPLSRTAAVPKTRFVGIFVPHGMAPGYWIPEGPSLKAGPVPFIMEPLEPHFDQTTLLSGEQFQGLRNVQLHFLRIALVNHHAIGI